MRDPFLFQPSDFCGIDSRANLVNMPGMMATPMKRLIEELQRSPTVGGCTICTGMSGNGWKTTGMTGTMARRPTAGHGSINPGTRVVRFAAAVGNLLSLIAARPRDSAKRPENEAPPWASGPPRMVRLGHDVSGPSAMVKAVFLPTRIAHDHAKHRLLNRQSRRAGRPAAKQSPNPL